MKKNTKIVNREIVYSDLFTYYSTFSQFDHFFETFEGQMQISTNFDFTGRIENGIPQTKTLGDPIQNINRKKIVLDALNKYFEKIIIGENIVIQNTNLSNPLTPITDFLPENIIKMKYKSLNPKKDSKYLYRLNHNYICEIVSNENNNLYIVYYKENLEHFLRKHSDSIQTKLKILKQIAILSNFLKIKDVCNKFDDFKRIFIFENQKTFMIKVADFSKAQKFNPNIANISLKQVCGKLFGVNCEDVIETLNEKASEFSGKIRKIRALIKALS